MVATRLRGATPHAIAIVGMHRSGTSSVTRLVNLLGAYVGEEDVLGRPLPENPEGFWEHPTIVQLHDRLLSALGTTWHTTCPLPAEWTTGECIEPFVVELRTLIETVFGGRQLWTWKDPRTCLFLPLWKKLLRDLDMRLSCVFVVRNPIDVAKSLAARNGFADDKSMGVWFNYNLSALAALDTTPTVFVSYDALLANWEFELRRCSQALGLDWPEDHERLSSAVGAFLKPAHRHSQSDAGTLGGVNPLVRQLFERMIARTQVSQTSTTSDGIEKKMYEDFRSFSALCGSEVQRVSNECGNNNATRQRATKSHLQRMTFLFHRLSGLRLHR